MSRYLLTPKQEFLDDPRWKNSTWRSPVVVEADSEEEARQLAAEIFATEKEDES